MSITVQDGTGHGERDTTSWLTRGLVFGYGLFAYLFFFATFLYALGFVTDLLVPTSVDRGIESPVVDAVAIDLALLTLFAVQHSGMARRGFKRFFTRFATPALERSTYVLCASAALALLLWQWRPVPDVVWQIDNPELAASVTVLGLVGWTIVLVSTFLISHFELFGLRQVTLHALGRVSEPLQFRTPGFYRLVRHPIYVGFIIAFWATATMTVGHLLFAAGATAYILVGIQLEERDLIAQFGSVYQDYRGRVAMLFPGLF